VYENRVETLFLNGKQELVISFLMVMNNISHSVLIISIPTSEMRLHCSTSSIIKDVLT
jgi:hypothetical protein